MGNPLGLDAVRRALVEDAARGDVTTRLLGAAGDVQASGRFVAEGDCVVAGLPVAALVFTELEAAATLRSCVAEGACAASGTVLATVTGTARTLLAGERVALNFLQRLSAIATLTRRAVEAVAGTAARVTHTRKTTPGLRDLERYAVRVGGGVDNRASLAEAVMWKDNHWVLLDGARQRLRDVLAAAPAGFPVVVEVETDAQLEEALAAGVTHLLADNQPPERVAGWVRRVGPGVTVQASGAITPENAAAYARAGAHLISIGSLTHSAPATAIRFELAPGAPV